MRMAKDTPEQLKARSKVIREGYKSAARVPLRTAELCREVIDLCQQAADIGNMAVMSDAGVGALMALAGVRGAIGYITFDGNMDTSIAIRTMLAHGPHVTFQAGGAIVWDSDPAKEYEETLVKARGMAKALGVRLE